MIEISHVSKRYGAQPVLRSVSLTWEPGQSVALIGPNGSGKTTLIKILLGLVVPDEGIIRVGGTNIQLAPDYRRNIGYMPQISRFPEQLKVKALFRLMKQLRPEIAESAYDLELFEQLHVPHYLDKRLGALSGGMKQQVSAALAFYFNPAILVLDEPTAALDPLSNELLKAKIRRTCQSGRLVITTSHILSDLEEISNHVVYLMDGQVRFDGSLDDLREQTAQTKLQKMIVTLLDNQKNYVEN